MKTKKGTNQHQNKYRGLKKAVWRDIVYFTIVIGIVSSMGYKLQQADQTILSPIPVARAQATMNWFTIPEQKQDVWNTPPSAGWDGFKDAARQLAPLYDYPLSVLLSQAALESNRGNSDFARNRHNWFGIGAYDNDPNLAFHYDNDAQCIIEYMRLVKQNFPEAYAARHNPDQMVHLLESNNDGIQYATDPAYVAKLEALPEWSTN